MSEADEKQMTIADAPETAPEKPKRGRPRKKAAEDAAAEGAGVGAEAPAKKPVRRRATKAAEEAGEAAAGKAAAEEAPKPRRTRKKAESDGAAPAEAAEGAPAVEAAVEKPRRGRPRKKAEDADEGAAEKPAGAVSDESAEADAAKKPARTAVVRKHTRGERGEGDRAERRQNNQGGNGGQNGQNGQGKSNQGGKKNNHDRNNRRQRHENRNREPQPSVTKEELAELKVADLRAKAAELGVEGAGLKKAELVDAVYEAICKAEGFTEVTGVLDIMGDGYGFLRTSGYLPGENDIYVGLATIRKSGLRKGDMVSGVTRPARPNDKFAALQKVTAVNGHAPELMALRPKFSELTPIFPDERLWMEHGRTTTTARVIDLTAPIGKGQRGLIVSPPKAGKTTVLKDIAAAITANNPEVHLMYLGIDERPEEATDMERSIRGEVVSSTFDMPSENHIQVAELVIERAKRLVEQGKDVVILLDSITRLARAYNLAQPASGRILSGGVDSTALYPPKRFLGAARNIENGGSLTILASALIETGSKMDEVIFEEFKGTGNMELKLDRNLADRRIFPAIDPISSGTRKEELLLEPQEAPLIWAVRRILSNTNSTERAMDMLIKSLKQTNSNQEFLIRTAKKAQTQQGRSDDNFEL
ncbi:transcription termination factor Rho [Adlercreutzia caecimuris]|uniref:Transcription termination factor Rho n=1 Tax=Adlercreutzia caecimuris B7 TaxID=1235794 RepID=R9KY36_9ACTN|nr:transcription termination factor Rho [Adlercreutzia caecimuris]EOS51449.1 transcription termination factor Rho [Adlercreutzia caecimuris B7]